MQRANDEDAFGRMLLDFHRKGACAEIIERDDGLITAGSNGPRGYFAPFEDWSRLDKRVLRRVQGRVLDVGCGAGRACLELQRRGFDVLGIDVSRRALQVCRERGMKKTMLLRVEDAARLPAASFDTVIMMGGNLGLLGGRIKAKRVLKALERITTPGARIVGVTLDPHATRDPIHVAYHRRNARLGRMPGQIRIRVRHGIWKSRWFDYLFMSERELRAMTKGTGWQLERTLVERGPGWAAVLSKTGA